VILPDVNILIYAFRPEMADHARYREWLTSVAEGDEPFGIAPQVLSSVVRICTNPRTFARVDPLDRVLAFAEELLAQPRCQIVTPGRGHWPIFRDLCREAQATGNLAQDAWFAALAIEWGCEWITVDRDYARFRGLRWRPPF
jgi:uncharacterized protein